VDHSHWQRPLYLYISLYYLRVTTTSVPRDHHFPETLTIEPLYSFASIKALGYVGESALSLAL
jgi:hypothetical protein